MVVEESAYLAFFIPSKRPADRYITAADLWRLAKPDAADARIRRPTWPLASGVNVDRGGHKESIAAHRRHHHHLSVWAVRAAHRSKQQWA